MAEYIEREKLAKALKIWQNTLIENYGENDEYVRCLDAVLLGVDNVPAADVRPVVRGRWEKGTGENGVTTSLFCSVCHYENRHWHEWNYCPNCGADMREES